MAENFDNTIAESVIPVRADLTEFTRQVDDALADVLRKFDAAGEALAKGMRDKFDAALGEAVKQLDALIVKADTFKVQTPENQPAKQEQGQQQGSDVSDIREIGRTVKDIETAVGTTNTLLDSINARLGN